MNDNVINELSKNHPGTGDIRLRIKIRKTKKANQSFSLFNRIKTEEGGFVSVDWGDGSVETLTGATTYSPLHVYAKAGEYIVKLTGSKFTEVGGLTAPSSFRTTVKEILSLKMPTDSTGVSLRNAFNNCIRLTGNIPAWDDCIADVTCTYKDCSGLTGNIPEWGVNITNTNWTYSRCTGLTGNIPEWGTKITSAYATYKDCANLTGNVPDWGANITNAYCTYYGCTHLTGNIPKWGAKITYVGFTYSRCFGLTGNIPAWGENITSAYATYYSCKGLTGNIPAWSPKITNASSTYYGCSGLTGSIPKWGENITDSSYTYFGCTGLTDCSKELLQDPMPSKIADHYNCVSSCAATVQQRFTEDWGGSKRKPSTRKSKSMKC